MIAGMTIYQIFWYFLIYSFAHFLDFFPLLLYLLFGSFYLIHNLEFF